MRTKARGRILNEVRSKKKIMYKVTPIRFTADQVGFYRREWWDIVWKLSEMNTLPKTMYPARMSFRFVGMV